MKTSYIFVMGPVKILAWQAEICTSGPTETFQSELRIAVCTSFLLLPELSVCVEDEARSSLLPLELDLLLKQPLFSALLTGDVLVEGLVTLPLLTAVIILHRTQKSYTTCTTYSSSRLSPFTSLTCMILRRRNNRLKSLQSTRPSYQGFFFMF